MHDSDFVPADQGLICVQRERRVENLSQDARTSLQYACKDGWDKSNLENVHEAFGAKMQTQMFSFYVYLYHTHPLGTGGPIGREEGGTSTLI